MKKQVLVIHGGNSYSSYDSYLHHLESSELDYDRLLYQPTWKAWLGETLPDYDVLLPNFPNSQNAVYDEWVIYFEKIYEMLGDDFVIIGHSLGAMFLAKYLNTHTLEREAHQLILIAGHYGEVGTDGIGSFGVASATGVDKSAHEIHLFHSTDDQTVPYASLAKFAHDIPTATVHSFTDRNHFNLPTIPELIEIIKN